MAARVAAVNAVTLVVLMRWPRRGEGKSRLAAEIGVAEAHELHHCFVADTLAWPAPRPRVLAVSPDAAAVRAARIAAPDAMVVQQSFGVLGARIAGAMRAAFSNGAGTALLVGTDSPSLPHRLLLRCTGAATESGAAMVPATDGGFVALAVECAAARRCGLDWLMGEIAWSTERAAADMRRAARACGLSIADTPCWYDVDTAADLDRLHADLRRNPLRAPRTLQRLEERTRAEPIEAAS